MGRLPEGNSERGVYAGQVNLKFRVEGLGLRV